MIFYVENILKYIDSVKRYVIEYDKTPAYNYKYEMKSPMFRGGIREITFSKNYNYNFSMNILKEITEHSCYDFIRGDQRFKDIAAELELYAKYE